MSEVSARIDEEVASRIEDLLHSARETENYTFEIDKDKYLELLMLVSIISPFKPRKNDDSARQSQTASD